MMSGGPLPRKPAAARVWRAVAGSRVFADVLDVFRSMSVAFVYRSLHHREMNRLQVALGWAQLGEVESVRTVLEEHVHEMSLLRCLLGAATACQQTRILRMLARLELHGQVVELRGAERALARTDVARFLRGIRRARRSRARQTTVEIGEEEVLITFS